MSHTVLGSSLDLLRQPENRWLCPSLLSGNRHMYLQMTWPTLFAKLEKIVDITRFTYPSYSKDSKKFLDLMEAKLEQAAAAQKYESAPSRAVIDCMRRDATGDVTDAEIKVESFSLLRAGTFHRYILPLTKLTGHRQRHRRRRHGWVPLLPRAKRRVQTKSARRAEVCLRESRSDRLRPTSRRLHISSSMS